jgi:2-methylcitrate dehydratase PrpD
MTASLTSAFVARLTDLHASSLAQSGAVDRMDDLAMDGIAVALAGASQPGPSMLARQASAPTDDGGATVMARAGRLPPVQAARVNGAAMHVLDYEPMWNPANHAVSTVLPALLALAETEDGTAIDGSALLSAFAIGIEAQARLRRASLQFEPGDLVFHPPGVVGPIGSAMACGLALGLDAEALGHAVGIAASRAGGVLKNVGSMTKALHCGGAAADGLEAAQLAALGFTADPDALGGPRGFLSAFFGADVDEAALTDDAPLAVLDPGPAFKFYPSQYGTHFVISAALALRASLPKGAGIDAVTIICPPMPYVDRPQPVSGLAGKFSFQYVAAVALLDGSITLASFSDERRFAADLQHLLPRIAIRPDPGREGRFDRMHVDLEARLGDGSTYRAICDGPDGIWGQPVPSDRLAVKARDCLAEAGMTANLASDLAHLSRYDATSLRGLIKRLALPCG